VSGSSASSPVSPSGASPSGASCSAAGSVSGSVSPRGRLVSVPEQPKASSRAATVDNVPVVSVGRCMAYLDAGRSQEVSQNEKGFFAGGAGIKTITPGGDGVKNGSGSPRVADGEDHENHTRLPVPSTRQTISPTPAKSCPTGQVLPFWQNGEGGPLWDGTGTP